jgi:hypothetical protein
MILKLVVIVTFLGTQGPEKYYSTEVKCVKILIMSIIYANTMFFVV